MDKTHAESISQASANTGNIKEAVCINAMRVYDSCSSKEYLENRRVYFTPDKHELIEQATNVRIRSAEVIKVFLHLEPVPFNQGFYAVDLNFYLDVCLDVFTPQTACPTIIHGVAMANKRVILFGSEGNVKMFSSGSHTDDPDVELSTGKVLPRAVCQVSEPIGLSAKISERAPQGDVCGRIPDSIGTLYGSEFDYTGNHVVYVTVGLFTIVQLVRTVPMLIPSYDFYVPEKESAPTSDGPREMFSKIEFPTGDFFPPNVAESSRKNPGPGMKNG